MPAAIYVFQLPEFINEVKVAQKILAKIMERQSPNLDKHMEWDDHIKGLYKLNIFLLVPADLFQIVKKHGWANGGSNWTGFRGAPSQYGYDVMNYHPPARVLPGGTNREIGGYEKQMDGKYYNAAEPSLNLEFKWNSGNTVTVNTPKKGAVIVPEVSYCLNVHVKECTGELVQGTKFYTY